MDLAPTDPVRLRVTSLTNKAIDYLRFMTGREVHARVARGGGAEDVLHIRLGGHLLKARLSGDTLPTGRDFFVRVEQTKEGGFRLVVLSGLGRGPAGGQGALGAGGAGSPAPGVPAAVYRAFLAFLGAGGRVDERTQKSRGDLARMEEAGFRSALKSGLAAVLSGGQGPDLNFAGEKIEFVLFDQWREKSEDGADTRSGSSHPDGRQGPKSDSEGEVLGWGHAEPAPASFFLRVKLPRLGTIGVLITAPDPHFQSLSIQIVPLQESTARLLAPHLGRWRELLGEELPGLERLALVPVGPPAGGSVDFSA